MSFSFEIDDAIVLLLGAPVTGSYGNKIHGITRLEKLVFLLERETDSYKWLEQKADFVPYNFGPFSEKVYQAVDTLAAAGIIEDSLTMAADDSDMWEQRENIGLDTGAGDSITNTTRNFRLTDDRGQRYYQILAKELPPNALREISVLKQNFAFLPLRKLIRYVYQKYDDFTTKSIIRKEILGEH